MKRTSITRVAAVSVTAAIVLTACSGSSSGTVTETKESAQAGADNKIIVAMASDITSMDPPKQNDSTSAIFVNHVYNRLMKIDDDGKLVPDLAESYEIVNDGLDYVFHLNENACFSDGTPVTANDVKFTYDRAKETPLTMSDVSAVSEIIVEDEHTVRIRLSESYAPFIYKTADSGLSILSKEHVEEVEGNGGIYGEIDNLLGSGPYVAAEWVPNDHYTLERNENYWGDTPAAEVIEVRVVPNDASRVFALEAGEVDIAMNVAAADCVSIESNQDVTLLSQPSTSITFLGMNVKSGAFSDAKVRQAVNMAVDRQEIIDVVMEGRGTPANSYINSMIPGWTDEVTAWDYNIDEARELLAEAGYPDGFECSIAVNGDENVRVGMLIQNQLAEIGINATAETYAAGAMMDVLSEGTADMYIYSWSNTSYDPDGSVYTVLHSENSGKSGNYTQLKDAELDRMIEEARAEVNQETRMEMYKDIQLYLKELNPWVPLYYKNENAAMRAGVKGFELNKASTHWFGDAHYEE